MNYLESSEYKDAKNQLKDEYRICFHKIETYLQFININDFHKESCLIQILDDFLSAQSDGRSLEKITGSNVKKYCDTMVQAEKRRNKSKLNVVTILAGIPFTIMFMALLGTIHNNENLTNLHHSIKLSAFSISYPILFLIYYIIKWSTAKALFHHAKASKVITTFVSVIILGAVFIISDAIDKAVHHAIPIPFPLFISVLTLSTIILVVVLVIDGKKNKQLKIIPESYEFKLEQVTCSNCGKEYDIDYPKCPHCKYKQ